MAPPDPTFNEARSLPARVVKYALQPTALVLILWYWASDPTNPLAFGIAIGSLHLVLGALERVMPARPAWTIRGPRLLLNVVVAGALTVALGVVDELSEPILSAPLASVRASLRLDVWPHSWPVVPQLLLLFLVSEGIWYWVHRAEHRWALVWRASGHGVHHSFKQLGALNFGLNHPFEFILLVLPSTLVGLLFGVGPAALGTALLTAAQASIAHCNLDLNSRGIGWLLTTNRYHVHHHSVVVAESNTNYGCAVILWDRLFGTFSDAPTREAGSGPTEPTLWQKTLMPIWEPRDTVIAPS